MMKLSFLKWWTRRERQHTGTFSSCLSVYFGARLCWLVKRLFLFKMLQTVPKLTPYFQAKRRLDTSTLSLARFSKFVVVTRFKTGNRPLFFCFPVFYLRGNASKHEKFFNVEIGFSLKTWRISVVLGRPNNSATLFRKSNLYDTLNANYLESSLSTLNWQLVKSNGADNMKIHLSEAS